MKNRFLVVTTGFNCTDNVRLCYKSLTRQTQQWRAVFISDGSTDNTAAEMRKIFDPRVICLDYDDNRGAALRRYEAIKSYGEHDDIVVLLGMDDLLYPNALERINKEYEAGKLMTYGSWHSGDRKILNTDLLDYPEEIHTSRDYRSVPYRSTAPNTFRKFLFDSFMPSDFKVDGEWIKATTESPLMFGLLELAGKDRIGVIKDAIYIYNRREKDSARARFGDDYQDYIYSEIIKRPKKKLYED